MAAHVLVRDLHKRYGAVEAVRGASFEIARGEIFGLLGPNGAGKTTTIECLIGLREADRGTLELGGIDVRRQPEAAKEKIGAALQSTALPDQITPREALRLFGSFYARRTAPETLLERFALHEKADARFSTLSGGQRQRLALALAFVNQPELVVLDEPTAGLDPQARRELHEQIAQLKRDGCTVLLATHQLEEAEALCDRVAIVDRGQVVALGAPRELAAQASALQTVVLTAAQPLDRARVAALPGVEDLTIDGNVLHFRTSEATAALAALTALLSASRTEIVDLRVSRASLEDVFLRLTQGGDGANSTANAHE
jgi:ABC-2 type transport system ATP-binding protein